MSKHTPGPWFTFRGTIVETREGLDGSYRRVIATCGAGWNEHNQPEAEANARLIAAAPELLSMVKKLAYNEGMVGEEEFRRVIWADMMGLIAKAEGE